MKACKRVPQSPRAAHRHPRGFALIITLSLMILLTVIAVGLLVLSSISMRSVSRESAMRIAQANARMGLMLALGELQKTAGPDTRITARAETLAKDTRVGVPVTANTPKAWWVGVSDSDPAKVLGNAGSPAVVWLVSGLEGSSPASQLSGTPSYPVKMIGDGSLDLATATGGTPVEAGRVKIIEGSKASGAYAWLVDDNGMKAQLAATRPEVRNDSKAGPLAGPFGGGVVPGTYDLSVLDQMGSLSSLDPGKLQKLLSTHNLTLLGLSASVTKSKYFSYTTSSQGVLSDVKNGGLKKDLTIAFEKPAVFSVAFPTAQPDKYIVVDPKKRPSELNSNYIHWGIFRDFYNLKSSLFSSGGIPSLAPTLFHKGGLAAPLSTDSFRAGSLGPHAMAASASSTPQTGLPYSNTFTFSPTNVGAPAAYLFNPIFPILGSLQQSAWVSRTPTGLRSNVQLFTTDYNPYNVGIMINGKSGSGSGPRIHNYPQVLFTASGSTMNRAPGLHDKLQTHARPAMQLEPGRSHVMGFGNDVQSGSEIDGSQYSENIGKIVAQSVYKDFPGATVPATGNVSLTYEFALSTPALLHGADEDPGDNEVAQVFFSPFAWDSISPFTGVSTNSPGKKFVRSVSASGLTQNNQVTMGFNLRTTKELQNAIRPLVDANIRAVWNNPRWDSPLGLPLLAAYSADGNGELSTAIPQMEFGTVGKGYAYWGNSRSASGGNDRVILFDVPRRDLVSIGQLQHANAGRFSYEPSYIVGNSYANPRIPLAAWRASVTDTFSSSKKLPWSIGGSFNLYDASYLVNEVAFDSYTFTTIPQVSNNYGSSDALPVTASTFAGLKAGTLQLPNPRYLPYKPPGSDFTLANLTASGSTTTGSYFHNAGHLVVDGAFNVNSTSVDAWEAFLSGTHKLPVQKIDANGIIPTTNGFRPVQRVRFPRAASHLQDGMIKSSIDDSYWTGFRELDTKEVRQLAEEIVSQVRQRGPFLTLGQFVNRKLEATDLGKSGPLQAALDLTVNKDLDKSFESPAATATFKTIPATSTQGAGFPGQMLQGDILQSLAPVMTVRSDTFTIRGYGEALDTGGKVTARAWCEAVVQRIPDPMPAISGTATAMAELIKPTSPFGRRFKILTFRWLHPGEV